MKISIEVTPKLYKALESFVSNIVLNSIKIMNAKWVDMYSTHINLDVMENTDTVNVSVEFKVSDDVIIAVLKHAELFIPAVSNYIVNIVTATTMLEDNISNINREIAFKDKIILKGMKIYKRLSFLKRKWKNDRKVAK